VLEIILRVGEILVFNLAETFDGFREFAANATVPLLWS
jgi:hypothetical protein